MLLLPLRNERTMPVEVGVCLGQSPPSYEWKAYQTAMFDMHSHQSVDYRKQSGLYKRQKSISHIKSDKLIGQLEQACLGLKLSAAAANKKLEEKPIKTQIKKKKKLSFADDHGQPLFTEKIIRELPHEPPVLRKDQMNQFVERLNLRLPLNQTEPENVVKKAFAFGFKQPMSNYIAFKEKLESNNIALENIVCRNRSILGTIKVRNVCFEKTVFVRMTFDSWRSHVDIDAKHMKNAYEGNLQDTFKFTTNVPKSYNTKDTIEFCICFNADSKQYWDNNEGENFKMICINPNLLSPEESDPNANFLPECTAPSPSSVFY